jgi:signal transduction histidine kinase
MDEADPLRSGLVHVTAPTARVFIAADMSPVGGVPCHATLMSDLPPDPGLERRAQGIAPSVDLHQVADALAANRDEILGNWLQATSEQPFHAGRHEGAVADHIPRLYDALVALLEREGTRTAERAPALDDPNVLGPAQDHARARFEQGLQPADVVTEFRLLRQEIGRALWKHLGDAVPTTDVIGAELLVHDALDGAITLALHALTTHIEEIREDFLATTIHDTRQPLASIKGFHQLIIRALGRPELDREHLKSNLRRATSEVDRMNEMLTTLADVSRLALGRLTLDVVSVDLNELVRAAIERLAPQTAPRVRLALPSTPARGEWDPAMLDRVIANLVSNALKYSPGDSPIDVAVRTEREAVHLTVQDYGIGLDPQDTAWLFRRYGRGRGATERGIQGLGLGLYLSHGIVETHGGRLWAESDGLGRGTTMHVDLPWSVPVPPVEPAPPATG